MKNYYSSNPTFYLGIDCIIFGFNEGEISLLLLKRNFEPAMGEWSLMGGFVQKDESVDDAAKRVLAELTGLENVYMEQVGAFGAIDRDPGERVVSIAYYALININEYDRELVQKHMLPKPMRRHAPEPRHKSLYPFRPPCRQQRHRCHAVP